MRQPQGLTNLGKPQRLQEKPNPDNHIVGGLVPSPQRRIRLSDSLAQIDRKGKRQTGVVESQVPHAMETKG